MITRKLARLTLYSLTFILLISVALGSASTATSDSRLSAPILSPNVYLPFIAHVKPRNFVIIVSDDQRLDMMSYMPLTQARIFDQGVTFSNAYITTPLCCPSRATILTGMYVHNHRVYDNYTQLNKLTFINRLHDAGYFTGIVGKYLNSWDGTYRAEFDYWVVFAGHGSAQRYFDPNLNINGSKIKHYGYMPYILGDYAINFLQIAKQRGQPFVLLFTPNTPHEPADPAPGDEGLYPDLPLYRPPSFMEADMSDKPIYLQARPPADPDHIDNLRQQQLQSLHALDLIVNAIMDELESLELEKDTVVMYISDNGVFWAEHTLDGKFYPYDEATHVPFAIRYDELIDTPRVESRLVANIDIAPTIYELAKMNIPSTVDGRSLVPLLTQEASEWREEVLIEGWGYYFYAALQTERYLYVETDNDISELYDNDADPWQLQNQYDNPAYASVVSELHTKLAEYKSQIQQPPGYRLFPFIMRLLRLED